ncbi:hypothetical protein A4A49_52504 [Nicotiana attenuata]|uniref:Defensin-like protein 298 n=1 Tax=Nicotiana attenuata TaxID=49451 RepID=A0A1J6I336_NICAT|nr:hypothetical protein A4A49_52504 [Nicotiana attenuata]
MAKTLRTLFLAVSFLLILCDVVRVETCQQTCQTREDCSLSCESGLATCVDGMCVCLADLKTYSADYKDAMTGKIMCKTTLDCRRDLKCKDGFPICVEGGCICSDQLGSILH